MAISGPVNNPLRCWTSLFDRLKLAGLSFKRMLEVMADAKWSPLYVEGLPAVYKARVLRYLLCEVASPYVSQQNVHVRSLDKGGDSSAYTCRACRGILASQVTWNGLAGSLEAVVRQSCCKA